MEVEGSDCDDDGEAQWDPAYLLIQQYKLMSIIVESWAYEKHKLAFDGRQLTGGVFLEAIRVVRVGGRICCCGALQGNYSHICLRRNFKRCQQSVLFGMQQAGAAGIDCGHLVASDRAQCGTGFEFVRKKDMRSVTCHNVGKKNKLLRRLGEGRSEVGYKL